MSPYEKIIFDWYGPKDAKKRLLIIAIYNDLLKLWSKKC